MNHRIRIAQVISHVGHGGAARVGTHIATGLDPEYFDVRLISLYQQEPTDYVRTLLANAGVDVHVLGRGSALRLGLIRRLARLLADIEPDIVHSHGRFLHYVAPATWRHSLPHVHTVHGLAETDPLSMRLVHRVVYGRRVRVVAVSRAVAESLGAVYGLADCPVIHNGIDVDTIQSPTIDRDAWRARHGFGAEDVLVACVAMFRTVKDHATLLDAFARAAADRPRLHLVLAGTGPTLAATEAKAHSLGVAARIHFLGERGDVHEILRASEVFALASLSEAHPLAIMEAMAAGCAVVATRVGGTPEVMDDGADGLLVPSGDAGALADAIIRVVDDTGLAATLGARAADRARSDFGLSGMVARYAEFFRSLNA